MVLGPTKHCKLDMIYLLVYTGLYSVDFINSLCLNPEVKAACRKSVAVIELLRALRRFARQLRLRM